MKYKKLFTIILTSIIFTGCSLKSDDNKESASAGEIINKLSSVAGFDETVTENVKEIETASQLGISPEDIEEGFICTPTKPPQSEIPDKIILIKAKDEATLENIEKALQSEMSGINSAWKEDTVNKEKIENHILKTKNNFVLLAITEEYDMLEKTFDNFFWLTKSSYNITM